MRRPLISVALKTGALVLALGSTVLFAQNPPAQQPPAGQPPAQPATAQPPAAPATPKLAFTTDAGLLLIQIKGDQVAAFEELISKLKAGAGKTSDAAIKSQVSGMKVFKAAEPAQAGNVLYVIMIDQAAKNTEYELFAILQKVLTPDELRDAAVIEMSKKAAAAFAQGYNKLSLTPVGGGM